MNGKVQEAIDWRTAKPTELDGARCILMTQTGTIIDGRLKASPPRDGYQATRFTLADFIDRLTTNQGLTLHPAGTNVQHFDLPAIDHLLERHDYHGFLVNQLHYRALDLTSLRLLWQSLGHNPYQHHQHGTHRVHDCLTRDITEYRTIRRQIKDHTA